MNDIKNDINLRQAVSRREQQLPPMPEGLNEKVMNSLTPRPLRKERGLKFWSLAVAACLVGFVVIFLAPPRTTEEQLPLALEEPRVESQEPSVESQEPRIERIQHFPKEGKDGGDLSKAPKRKRVVRQDPQEEPLLEEAEQIQEEVEEEYLPARPDLYLLAVAETQDIRSRGEQLCQEVNQIIINAKK
ncbi:MAG: hypothetical protein K5672_02910 [Bacteroidaceae bacterium]|nr:hypothetical protein [Bacteroidaceae bacterium]